MRMLALFAAIVCLISCYGMDANGQTEVQSSFVGASLSVTNGTAGGIIGMNQLCKESWGASAHMCTWDEFYHSAGTLNPTPPSPVPKLPNGALGLWASTSWHNCFFSTAASKLECQESDTDSWVVPPAPLAANCSLWSSNASGASGSAVIIQIQYTLFSRNVNVLSQSFGFVPCATVMPVACCAP
jgi:hypothetical protein